MSQIGCVSGQSQCRYSLVVYKRAYGGDFQRLEAQSHLLQRKVLTNMNTEILFKVEKSQSLLNQGNVRTFEDLGDLQGRVVLIPFKSGQRSDTINLTRRLIMSSLNPF